MFSDSYMKKIHWTESGEDFNVFMSLFVSVMELANLKKILSFFCCEEEAAP